MPGQASIEVETTIADVAVVTLRGEHDLRTVASLERAFDIACWRPTVLVDLVGCTFIDSTVIAALLTATHRMQTRKGRLELIVGTGASPVRRALELIRAPEFVNLRESRAAALTGGLGTGEGLRAVSERIDETTLRRSA